MTEKRQTIISSDDIIQDFDSHIKVSAGPGAGKTTWLVGHILHVVRTSKRLHKAAKIVCISYTNAASEAIRSKLGECADIVETSTIHSFLFSNVVRPYLHMLKDEKGQCLVAHSLVQNHYEPNPTYGRVNAWLTEVKVRNKTAVNNVTAYAYIKKAVWQRQGDGTWKCAPIKWTSKPKYMPTTKLHIYKDIFKQVKTSLVRRGVILFTEEHETWEKNTKLERLRFRFPEEFYPFLPLPFGPAKSISGRGNFNQTVVRDKLMEILDRHAAIPVAKELNLLKLLHFV